MTAHEGEVGQGAARRVGRHSRLGVSGRLLGAIAVPVLVLALVLGTTVADSRRDAQRAEAVSANVALLRQLVTLRSAVFQERLAAEIFVPSRRPPPDLLRTTTFGERLDERPESLNDTTDSALAAIPPAERPFTSEQLERVRRTPAVDSSVGGAIQGRFDSVDSQLQTALSNSLDDVTDSATRLGDVRLIRSATLLQQSVELPEEAGLMVAELADLWTSAHSLDPSCRLLSPCGSRPSTDRSSD